MTNPHDVDRELERIRRERKAREAANKVTADDEPPVRALIKLEPDQFAAAAAATEQAMVSAALPIFEHSEGRLVYPVVVKVPGIDNTTTSTAALCEIAVPLMRQFMGTAAVFKQFRRDKWQPVEPPEAVAKLILCRRGFWPFPRIRGVLTVPTLRPDGSLLTAPGYDQTTGLFLLDPLPLPAMLLQPTKEDAKHALELLIELLAEFPFVDEASRSVALSGFIRAVEEHDAQAGLLCVKILERRSLLLGLDTPARIDPIQVQIAATPAALSSVDRIRAAVDRLRIGNGSGNGSDQSADTPQH